MTTLAVVPIRSSTPLRQWLLIVAIAAGLIGMHNLVVPATSTHDAQPHTVGVAPTHLGMDMGGALMGTAARGVPVATVVGTAERVADVRAGTGDRVGRVSVSASGCCPCMGAMMGHPCQAVLGADAGAAAEAIVLAATTSSHDAPLPMPGAAARTLPARSPPSNGVRFSQLGVWRR
jgi:hypothetical protein